ncbi:hypothetical protein PG987_004654 [Apiospora arundinis]
MSRPPMSRRGLSSRGSNGGGASVTSPSASLLFGEITAVPELSRSPIDDSASATSDDYFRPITPVTYYGGDQHSNNNTSDRGSNGNTSSLGRTRELSSLLNSLHHRYDHLQDQVQQYNDDNATDKMTISSPILDTKPSMPTLLLQPTVYNPNASGFEPCSEITAVQRDIEAEEAQRRIAEDPGLRASMLRKAKATVLSKLSEHFPSSGANPNHTNNIGAPLGRKLSRKDSMAATAAANSSNNNTYGASAWFRFGGGGARNIHPAAASTVSTLTDVRSMDVPILFSRG